MNGYYLVKTKANSLVKTPNMKFHNHSIRRDSLQEVSPSQNKGWSKQYESGTDYNDGINRLQDVELTFLQGRSKNPEFGNDYNDKKMNDKKSTVNNYAYLGNE